VEVMRVVFGHAPRAPRLALIAAAR
jgi:hypothetical protein